MKDDLPVTTVKSLSDCNRDEYWLQDKIYEDPSILALGDLEVVGKEKVQSSGGRLDLLLKNPEDDSMFEVEVMLGETDESHIIRTIEYWELEKRRWPKRSHTAVLVAESINTRFFNVVQLLSQSVPIIGIQVSVIELAQQIGLHFTTMINSYQEPEVESDSPQVDEEYWKTEHPETLVFAKTYATLAESLLENVKLGFSQNYIALTICGQNRVWIRPRKAGRVCLTYILEQKAVDGLKTALEAKGINLKIKLGTKLEFTAEKDSATKYPDEHRKLLLGLYAKDLKVKTMPSIPAAPILDQTRMSPVDARPAISGNH
jgi:hypothetical protein